jgi:DNA polymerase V
MKVVPIYIDAGISSFESPATEYKDLDLSLDELLITHPNATFIGRANGTSLEGIGIFSGDLLIVDRAKEVKHGNLVVVNYNGTFCCKILDSNNRQLLSASPEHKPVNIQDDDSLQFEGVVSYSVRIHSTDSSFLCSH